LLETQHSRAATGQVKERGAAHRPESEHDDVVAARFAHRLRNLKQLTETSARASRM